MEGSTELQNQEGRLRLEQAPPKEVNFRQRVEQKFNQAFAEVSQEPHPQISVDIFFSYHNTPEDLEGLSERIRQTDIYIPEAFSWSKRHLELLRVSSSGDITLAELHQRLRRYPPIFRKQVKDVYDSHKAITFIDVPARQRLTRESNEGWSYNPPYEGNFSQMLDYTRTSLDNPSSHQNNREQYMLRQITPKKVEELFEKYPWLGSQQRINILLSLGVGHAPMPPDYSKYSFLDEGIIRHKFGEKVNDELTAKIFLESFFENLLSMKYISPRVWLTRHSRKISMLERRILSQVSFEDAQRVFNYRKSRGVFPKEEFDRIFDEKGIKIPRNEKELDAFLAKSDFPQRVSTQ